jgi:enoyl-CoA hydratase/carnithine racemase
MARATEAVLGGDDLDAAGALRLGLVNEIAAEDLLDAAHARALRMARRAPLSFGAAKRLLHLAADSDLRSTMTAESLAQAGLLATADHREGLAAARERREPLFTGR